MNVIDTLKERGFIAQMTHEEEMKRLFDEEKVAFYIGFDPTADSLHVGHFLALMAMAHLQRAGHRPICLVGGGTGTVGDPSGKTDMRKMLTREQIDYNGERFKRQMSRFIDFSGDKALLLNNGDWLLDLNYVQFLRDVGAHFSVNRMLAAECYRQRMERGLTFLEFNYMVMQAYDFYHLHETINCKLQMGGDDQWSNIIAGVELIRRKTGKPAYGITLSLLTTSEGKKMGKTEKGALWLDPEKTPPYDFYQYWRNVADGDVEKCLALLTFLPLEEVRRLGALRDREINTAKKILAYEVTKLVHGQEEAEKAKQAAEALFGGGGDFDNVPTIKVAASDLGAKLLDVLVRERVFASKGEAKRLLGQNGFSVNGERVTDIDTLFDENLLAGGSALIKKGKKNYFKIVVG